MNFDFSDELKQLRDEARRFLTDRCPPAVPRRILETDEPYDRTLWQSIAEMGWTGAAIPEKYGGVGLGRLAVCVLAEELGYHVAPVPFASSVYLATEALLLYRIGSAEADIFAETRNRRIDRHVCAGRTRGHLCPGETDGDGQWRNLDNRETCRTRRRYCGFCRCRGERRRGAVVVSGGLARCRRRQRSCGHHRSNPIACETKFHRGCRGASWVARRARKACAACWIMPPYQWHSSRLAVPRRHWKWRTGMPRNGMRLAARSGRFRASSTNCLICTSGRTRPLQRLLRCVGRANRGRGAGDCCQRGTDFRLRGRLVRDQGKYPNAWRHGLHLANGLSSVLPARETAGFDFGLRARMEAAADCGVA